jgi:hypothetical protein
MRRCCSIRCSMEEYTAHRLHFSVLFAILLSRGAIHDEGKNEHGTHVSRSRNLLGSSLERDGVATVERLNVLPNREGNKGETMPTEQAHWAAQIREIPAVFRSALLLSDDHAIRHRPAASAWSAVEVVGHMIDKMQIWASRVERILVEERPALPGYDQDALVRDHDYVHADPEVLLEHLRQACERFATLVERIPISALQREGVHEEFGPMALRQCIETPLESASQHLEQLRVAQTLV